MAEMCSLAEAPDMPNLPSVPKDTVTTSPVEDQDSDGEWEPPTVGSKEEEEEEEEEVEEVEEEDVEESLDFDKLPTDESGSRYVNTSIQSVLAFVPFLTASSNVRAPLSRATSAATSSVHDDFVAPQKKSADTKTKNDAADGDAPADLSVLSRYVMLHIISSPARLIMCPLRIKQRASSAATTTHKGGRCC